MFDRLFGTDGIRARAGAFPLNEETGLAIGRAVGERLKGAVLVGQDTRISSPWLFGLLQQGIEQAGSSVEPAGVIPTPAVALLTREYGFAGGIMISASHNAFEDNGIKIFDAGGRKIGDSAEVWIEARILSLAPSHASGRIPDTQIRARNTTPWPSRYMEILHRRFPPGAWLQGLRIMVDCANGALSVVAPVLLRDLGAQTIAIHDSPDGRNINDNCGSVHIEDLQQAVPRSGADFGVAFDGDGDRAMFVSASGRLLDGDAVLLLMARRLKCRRVVGTSMTNYSLERMLASQGCELVRVAVGDRYVFEEMLRSGAVLGGEPSGHVIFQDFGLSGDGLMTTLKVAEAIVSEGQTLDSLTADWEQAPQLLRNLRVMKRVPLDQLPETRKKTAEIAKTLVGRGRIVVRYSGTEPLLRVMIESDDAHLNERLADEMSRVFLAEVREKHIDTNLRDA